MTKMHRKGTTLIETVVLGTLVSLTLATMSLFTHLLLKSSQQLGDRGQVRLAVARLQEHFDRDSAVVPMVATRADKGEMVWRSTFANGGQLEYRADLRTVNRQVLDAAGQVEQRDQFRLPPTYRFTSSFQPEGDSAIEIKVEQEQAAGANVESSWHATGLRIVVTAAARPERGPEKLP